MNIENIFTRKRVVFMLIFFILVLIGKNVNFSPLLGAESQFFTLYQFFGPTAGAFLGPIFGGVAVLFAQLSDFLIVGKEFSLISVLRFLPMLFAVFYFGSKNKTIKAIVPLLCILLFLVHPVGREAWLVSLYWLIPVLAVVIPSKWKGKLFFKSYGATFAAHAVGGTIWLYTVPMSAGQWVSLVPIIAYERFLFGLGIAGSYVVFNTLLYYIVDKWNLRVPKTVLLLDKKYTLSKLLHLKN
jgi:hypothetical protein